MWAYNKAANATNWFKDGKNPIYFESAHHQWLCNTVHVYEEDRYPGDLVFYDTNNDFVRDHVGIYIGCGKIVHARGKNFGIQIDPVDYRDVDTYGRVVNVFTQGLCSGIFNIIVHSPVDLVVTDPDGITLDSNTVTVNESEAFRGIPGVYEYFEADIDGDGETDDVVTVIERKMGEYQIEVVPEEGASPTDTYSLEIKADGEVVSIAENVPLGDVPSHEHVITVTETGIGTALPVETDIKPGSDDYNCIKAAYKDKGKACVPVAILSSSSIDLSIIDANTVEIDDDDNPTTPGVGCVKSSLKKDVDGDGLPDFVFHFPTRELYSDDLLGDGMILYVTGLLSDGRAILGSDVIHLAGGPYCSD
jgi:hypothetical protein